MLAVVAEPIDPQALLRALESGDGRYGGVVTFLGVVRGRSAGGRPVLALEYEAHAVMAVAEFERIAAEAREAFGDLRTAIAHRTGRVAPGEIAVAVTVAAEHRGAAFQACEYTIDQLKRRAPIWKKEIYADGSAWIESTA